MSITTRAAVRREPASVGDDRSRLDEPKANEVRIKFYAAGLCHSDDHIQKGDARDAVARGRRPRGRGHRRRGRRGRHRVKPGDHVICSFIPACGALPLLLDRPPEHVRRGAERRHRHVRRRHVPVPPGRRGLRRVLRARHVLPVRRGVASSPCIPIPDDIPFEVACAGRLRRADRLGLGGARGRSPGRAHRGDLRRRAGSAATRSRAPGSPARRTSSWWTRSSSSGRWRWSSGRRTRSPPPRRPTTSSSRPPGASSPTTRSSRVGVAARRGDHRPR